jgi:hypothetical protein
VKLKSLINEDLPAPVSSVVYPYKSKDANSVDISVL